MFIKSKKNKIKSREAQIGKILWTPRHGRNLFFLQKKNIHEIFKEYSNKGLRSANKYKYEGNIQGVWNVSSQFQGVWKRSRILRGLKKFHLHCKGPDTRYNLGYDLVDTIHWIQ